MIQGMECLCFKETKDISGVIEASMQQYFVKGRAISPVTIEDKETSKPVSGHAAERR